MYKKSTLTIKDHIIIECPSAITSMLDNTRTHREETEQAETSSTGTDKQAELKINPRNMNMSN